MPRRPSDGKTRFTLWLSGDVQADLAKLQEQTGKASIAEVVREAIEVYRSLMHARAKGTELLFEDAKSGERGRIWLLPGPPPKSR